MAGILLNVPLAWRSEINAIAAKRRQTVNAMLRELVGREYGLGGQPARGRETVTQKIARTWHFPGDRRADVGATRGKAAEGAAQGVPHAQDGASGAGRPGRGGDAAGRAGAEGQ